MKRSDVSGQLVTSQVNVDQEDPLGEEREIEIMIEEYEAKVEIIKSLTEKIGLQVSRVDEDLFNLWNKIQKTPNARSNNDDQTNQITDVA